MVLKLSHTLNTAPTVLFLLKITPPKLIVSYEALDIHIAIFLLVFYHFNHLLVQSADYDGHKYEIQRLRDQKGKIERIERAFSRAIFAWFNMYDADE